MRERDPKTDAETSRESERGHVWLSYLIPYLASTVSFRFQRRRRPRRAKCRGRRSLAPKSVFDTHVPTPQQAKYRRELIGFSRHAHRVVSVARRHLRARSTPSGLNRRTRAQNGVLTMVARGAPRVPTYGGETALREPIWTTRRDVLSRLEPRAWPRG